MKTIFVVFLISFVLVGCFPVARNAATPTPSPILPSPTPSPILPTPTPCPFVRNPGPPPPEVISRAGENLTAMYPLGIRGAVKVIANGEYTCDHYAVQDVSFEYTIYADDLNDQQTLQEHAAKIDKSAKDSLQGWNLGSIKIRFVTGQECFWDEQQNACVDIRPLSIP